MAGFGACQEIRLEISCSGSRSKLHLEPYGAQTVPKPCFAKINPCQEAMPCRPSWILPDKKPMRSGVGCLRRFFSKEKCNPQIWDMPTRPNFQRFFFLSFFNKKWPKCSTAAFFAVISAGTTYIFVQFSYMFRTVFDQFSCNFRTFFVNIDP